MEFKRAKIIEDNKVKVKLSRYAMQVSKGEAI
jgi:hypothetical protein